MGRNRKNLKETNQWEEMGRNRNKQEDIQKYPRSIQKVTQEVSKKCQKGILKVS